MKDKSIKIRSLLLGVALLLLIVPYFQSKFNVVNLTHLKGAISEGENSYFSFSDWFSGSYQEREEAYLNETFGFRSFFIRLNNQLAFSFFNKAKANGVVVGKENYLFEENYIKAYYGTDYMGRDSIARRMNRLKYVQDTLARLDKNLILVFAAGKGSFYPEYFPEKYKTEKGVTNYETHLELAQQMGITHIDFNSYFVNNKGKSKYPLYPQYGIHWSYYGMYLAADSMIRYMEQARDIDIPELYWKETVFAQPKEDDYDIADGLNILRRLKSFDMAYAPIQIQSDPEKTKPSVVVIADSYYWGMFNVGISNAFAESHFWYYNKQIYPDSYLAPLETSQVSLQEEIDRHDLFIVMATEATLPDLGWGFIENAYDHFKGIKRPSDHSDPEFQKKVNDLRNYIKTDKEWMKHIEQKAAENQVSVDSMITLDAIWQVRQQN